MCLTLQIIVACWLIRGNYNDKSFLWRRFTGSSPSWGPQAAAQDAQPPVLRIRLFRSDPRGVLLSSPKRVILNMQLYNLISQLTVIIKEAIKDYMQKLAWYLRWQINSGINTQLFLFIKCKLSSSPEHLQVSHPSSDFSQPSAFTSEKDLTRTHYSVTKPSGVMEMPVLMLTLCQKATFECEHMSF